MLVKSSVSIDEWIQKLVNRLLTLPHLPYFGPHMMVMCVCGLQCDWSPDIFLAVKHTMQLVNAVGTGCYVYLNPVKQNMFLIYPECVKKRRSSDEPAVGGSTGWSAGR